ncbi:hypothetical protein M758_3G106500 [Ceratodon purpureus]|nr:hypothetical protein M758_3G106500 [Ceratodon purpureus]
MAAMTGICRPLALASQRESSFWGTNLSALPRVSSGNSQSLGRVAIRAEGFDLWQVLGGRGLKGGEDGLRREKTVKVLEEAKRNVVVEKKKKGTVEGNIAAAEGLPGTFDKELGGWTGGFPGGEKGLRQFVETNPPPAKVSSELQKLRESVVSPAKPKATSPPLLMPGMTVIVNSPKNPYHDFSGIVQRVTDGKAGVLFEGGNWDKLVSFRLQELERTSQGPPMSHPKSAILERMVVPDGNSSS